MRISKIVLLILLTSAQHSLPMSWAYQKYINSVDYLKNMWVAKQVKAIAAKTSAGSRIETEWAEKYKYKETEANKLITDAEASAIKFRDVVQNAGLTNPLMEQFILHPEKFLFGASSSSYQYEGGLDEYDLDETGNKVYRNANAQFYSEKGLPLAGDAIDFFNRYEGDIKQMKEELGINCFRLSIAWDRIQPKQNEFDQVEILKYVAIIRALKENNIEPIVVLHHYTIPTWFEMIGGFEKEENSDYFVEFAKRMYIALYEYVTYWSTFNAIEGYAFKGYKTLDGPPGKTASLVLTQQVMANMLETHVRIYQAIKNQENGLYFQQLLENNTIPNPQIGIQKNIVVLDPSPRTNLITHTLSSVTSVIGEGAQNKGFFDFFTTGTFNIIVPPTRIYLHNDKAPESIDWIGLNVYSNMHMYFTKPQEEVDEDKQTANKTYRDYPEGIYRAAQEINNRIAQPLEIPIIITENGIATNDDEKRTRFFRRALFTIRMLIKEGFPIIGYTPWSSHDNYEWPTKKQPNAFTDRRYGFFHVQFNKASPHYLKRTLKNGANYYRDFIKTYFDIYKTTKLKVIKPWTE